jgi:hypothetical protein
VKAHNHRIEGALGPGLGAPAGRTMQARIGSALQSQSHRRSRGFFPDA